MALTTAVAFAEHLFHVLSYPSFSFPDHFAAFELEMRIIYLSLCLDFYLPSTFVTYLKSYHEPFHIYVCCL